MTIKDLEKIPLGKVKIHMNSGAKIDGLIIKEAFYYILSNSEELNGFFADDMLDYDYSWMIYYEEDLERIYKIIPTNSYKDMNLYNLKQYDNKRKN